METEKERVKIHYVGYSHKYDEWKLKSEIKYNWRTISLLLQPCQWFRTAFFSFPLQVLLMPFGALKWWLMNCPLIVPSFFTFLDSIWQFQHLAFQLIVWLFQLSIFFQGFLQLFLGFFVLWCPHILGANVECPVFAQKCCLLSSMTESLHCIADFLCPFPNSAHYMGCSSQIRTSCLVDLLDPLPQCSCIMSWWKRILKQATTQIGRKDWKSTATQGVEVSRDGPGLEVSIGPSPSAIVLSSAQVQSERCTLLLASNQLT